LMTRASYFACLSRHEGFGIAAIEAMSAGLMPVLSAIPPFRKIVEEAHCGVLLPLGQSADIGAAELARLHRAMLDAPSGDREQRIAFTRRYDWSSVVDRYDTVYRDALSNDGVRMHSLP
jgi:alpha-1,3-mannosyltransferase